MRRPLTKIMEAIAFGLMLTALLAVFGGWWLSTAVGIIHNEWAPIIPTLGFWSAVKIIAILSIGTSIGRSWARYHA